MSLRPEVQQTPVEEPVRGDGDEQSAAYGSDLVVDALRSLGYRYLPLNPGSSFRGLHDSVVNYGGNRLPQLLLCLHEEIAVSLAHGYAKASGLPAAAAVHDLVGLMHASMAVYNAACDQVPLLILGGSGPADPTARRAIDWIHSANLQGELVRDYVKWDAEALVPDVFGSYVERAHTISLTGPQGPTYVSLDAQAQEKALGQQLVSGAVEPSAYVPRLLPDPDVVARAVDALVEAGSVAVVGGRALRDPAATALLVELVELLGAAYQDERNAVAFPTAHPHNCNADRKLLGDVDVVLAIGVGDLPGLLTNGAGLSRSQPSDQLVIEASYGDLGLRSWSNDRGLPAVSKLALVGDPMSTLLALLERLREKCDRLDAETRAAQVKQRSTAARANQQEKLRKRWNDQPISPARLVSEVWDCVGATNPLLLLRNTRSWPEGIWQFRGAGDFLGHSVGAGVGYGPGAMVGGALAARDDGRFAVGIIGDGDFLMSAGALWTAVHYRIPLLAVVNDNSSFYNDEEHQRAIAEQRGRPAANSWIGMRLEEPRIAIADLARAYGCWAAGPVVEPAELSTALADARDHVLAGAVAVVHVRTNPS